MLLFPDASKPTVTVNITYLVGSRMEGYGETGMAHLLEHMVFKGTPKHPRHRRSEMTRARRRFNGTTWVDRTNYFESCSQATTTTSTWALDSRPTAWSHSFIARKDLDAR